MKGNILLPITFALALVSPVGASASTLTPIADFASHPAYGSVKISPNGEYLAVTVDKGEQDVLAVMRTSDLTLVKVNQLPDSKSVGSFYWVSPDRLMFNAIKKLGGPDLAAQLFDVIEAKRAAK